MIIIEIRPCLLTYFVFACLPFYAWRVFFSYLDINCAEEAIYLQPIGHLVVFIVLNRPEHVRTCRPPHRGSKWLKSAKFKFTWSHFANFSSNYFYDFRFRCLNAFHIQNLSNCGRNKIKNPTPCFAKIKGLSSKPSGDCIVVPNFCFLS